MSNPIEDSQNIINHLSRSTALTALHFAAWQGHVDVAESLLRHGADREIADWHDLTPASRAACYNHRGVLEVLSDHHASKAPPTLSPYSWPLSQAAGAGHLELVKWFLPLHPADSKDIALQAAMYLARQEEKQGVLEYLSSEQTAASLAEDQ